MSGTLQETGREAMGDVGGYFCEWEDEEGYCTTYPATVTAAHAAGSYGRPVVVIDGEARGPAEMPAGELWLPRGRDELARRLAGLGYLARTMAEGTPDTDYGRAAPVEGHWHPDARRVRF